jgi:lipopolysaccharide export system protein LptC
VAAQPGSGSNKAMDWNSRARSTAQESKRYTHFVGVMKRALLGTAAVVLGAVLIYSMLPRHKGVPISTQSIPGLLRGDLTMMKPRLTGLDASGNPYVVTADKAIQDSHNTRRAHLFKIDADLTDKKRGTWTNLHAPTGLMDANAHTLQLFGPVDTFSDNGYEMHTMLANVDLANGIVRGPRMAVGQGPLGNMRADSFYINRDKHIVALNGNVHMTIYPSAMKKGTKTK